MRSAIPYTDHPSTYMGFLAVMAALEQRRWSGKGQWIDLSQYEVGIHMIGDVYVEHSFTGETPPRLGNTDPSVAPYGVYRCRGEENWVALEVRTDDDWQRFRQAMGDPEWARNPRFQAVDGRTANRDELDAALTAWTSTQEPYDVQAVLQANGIPAGVTLDSSTLMLDPHLRDRGFYRMVDHDPGQERVGRRPFPGPSAAMSRTPGDIDRPAPMLGQHNEQVFSGILGINREELDELEREGVIGTRPIYADIPPGAPGQNPWLQP
jgi:crotonobetainyl-CoA:carnitine CoA-transferase CaiB-like acyl-CoA transferase